MRDISKLLENIPPEEFIKFIASYAENDDKFRNELLVTFGEPDADEELKSVKERMQQSIRYHTHSGYIGYGDCMQVCRDFDEITEQGQKRLTQGYSALAYSIGLAVFLKAYWLVSNGDDSSGCGSDTIHAALELLHEASKAATSETDKKSIYEKCCKEAKNKVLDGWGSERYKLLATVANLVTPQNKNKIFDVIESLDSAERAKDKSYYSDRWVRILKLEICKYLYDEDEYTRQIEANLDIDEVRKIAIARAVEKSDFERAETLCFDRLKTVVRDEYYWTREWYGILYDIHVKSGDKSKQTSLAEKLLIKERDTKFYDILKELLIENNTWEREYPRLLGLCAENMTPESYMWLLNKEDETQLLFEEVQKSPNAVIEYGKKLSLYYPDEIIGIFLAVIREQAAEAHDRKAYGKVCKNIQLMAQSGGVDEAFSLIAELLTANKRRPAMLEELQSIEKKLRKDKKL